MADHQFVKINLKGYDPDDFDDIADDIIEFIKDRSDEGVGVKRSGRGFTNYDFPEYSPSYEKFKGSSRVNLFLDGDMLDAIQTLETDDTSVTIGFIDGTDENAKAEGNQIGSYGKPSGNPKKARRFLGITKEDLAAVLAAYEPLSEKVSEEE